MRADIDQVRADDHLGRSGVVGGAGGFVRGEEIEEGTGAGGSSRGIGQARERASERQRERRTPKAFPLEIRHVRRRPRWRTPADRGDDALDRALWPARAITGQKTEAAPPSTRCYCTPGPSTLFV
jgi:hypothetical protein